MPTSWQGQTITVDFDGFYMNSEVWRNGERFGGLPHGYLSFHCDLTAHLKPSGNVLAVRVDNSLESSARWHTAGPALIISAKADGADGAVQRRRGKDGQAYRLDDDIGRAINHIDHHPERVSAIKMPA